MYKPLRHESRMTQALEGTILPEVIKGPSHEYYIPQTKIFCDDIFVRGHDEQSKPTGIKIYEDTRAFRRERAALTMLAKKGNHPSIVLPKETFALGDYHVATFPLIPTRDLVETSYKQPKFSDLEIALVARDVGSALDYAHRIQLFNGDVKPKNILIAKNRAWLVDWGLSYHKSMGNLKASGLTGTPGFIAPEIIREQMETKNKETDMYGLGAVTYWMTTGKQPFVPQNIFLLREQRFAMYMREALLHKLPPAHHSAGVSKTVSKVIGKAMALKPEVRFTSGEEFSEALMHAVGVTFFSDESDLESELSPVLTKAL